MKKQMNDLRLEEREIVNYGRLHAPNERRGEIKMVKTSRGDELRWVAE